MSTIKEIQVGDLRKPRYQRDLSPTFVRQTVKAYDPKLVGTIVVSERDEGLYYVIDGWHRREIVQELFGAKHPLRAEVHRDLSEQDEADMFDSLDTKRQKLTSRDHFAGRGVEGNAIENAAFGLLRRLLNRRQRR